MAGHDGGGVTMVNGVVTMVNGGVAMCGYQIERTNVCMYVCVCVCVCLWCIFACV